MENKKGMVFLHNQEGYIKDSTLVQYSQWPININQTSWTSFSMMTIHLYAPTTDAEEDAVEEYNGQVQSDEENMKAKCAI